MFNRLSANGSKVYVHQAKITLKSTKAFTHGGIMIDRIAHTITFAKLPALPLPPSFVMDKGTNLDFQLVAPDGELRKQTRSVVFTANEKKPDILRAGGKAKTTARFPKSDGWAIVSRKWRAYFNHQGVETTGSVPQWLKDSAARQRQLWNRLAWLCREARRQCSPVAPEAIKQFVNETILPGIDAYNASLGRVRAKEKIKHPAKLKKDSPGVDGLWVFIGSLRKRIAEGRAVPDGLFEQVQVFAAQFTSDYAPINTFLNTFDQLADREARALVMKEGSAPISLRPYETRPVVMAFKAVLERRKKNKLPWSEGWPLIKYSDSPNADSWGLHFYFNKAGVGSELLGTPRGLPGLTLGEPISPSRSGHQKMNGRRTSKRSLHAAEINVPGYNKEQWSFRFAVLQHQPIPAGSHVKEWKLIYKNGELRLCLIVELQRRVVAAGPVAAGLDVGWRRTDNGIRFATLYEPQSDTFREMEMDLLGSSSDTIVRKPFCIDLGPNRWDKRNTTKLLPEWKVGDPLPGCFDMRPLLASRRSTLVKEVRTSIQEHLGQKCPVWIEKAGRTGLLKLQEEFKEDEGVQQILGNWMPRYDEFSEVASAYFGRSTKRIEYGQMQVAHDVFRYLQEKGTNHIIVETSFVAKISQKQDNEDHPSLKKSQKYRQFASVSRFVKVLKNIAPQYGVIVDAKSGVDTTRECHHCGHRNPTTEKEASGCEKCGMLIYQDQNAAINLSRAGSDPETSNVAA